MSYKDQKKAATENKQIETIDVGFRKFEKKGDSLLGMLLKKTDVQSGRGDQTYLQYLFDTDDGKQKCHLGRVADGEAGALMRVGCIYDVQFLGQQDIGGNRRVNQFKITHIITSNDPPVGGEDDIPF